MITYVLKFSACLFIFLLFYKFFLEKESFHKIKRFYLLTILVLSASIPLITFTQYVEVSTISVSNSANVTSETISSTNGINWPLILWGIYGLGLLLFLLKFIINLIEIRLRVKNNQKFKEGNIFYVLLNERVSPHTFFNYIFFNQLKYKAKEIPKEVFWHEQTHAEQRHSIDVLIVEFVQVIFWFNPIIFLLKKCIKLNHEFLADQGVLAREVDAAYYQNTLLAFSSSALQPQLANAINYSLIKKRFTVMKTQSSKKVIWIRSFLFLPLLALLLFSFASRPILEIEVSEKDIILELQQQKEASKQEIVEYNKLANKISSLIKKENIRLKSSDVERLKYLYNKMSKSQRSSAEPFPDFPEPPPAPNAPTAVQPDLPPPPPIPANVTPEQKAKYERATKLYKEKAARAKEKEVYHLKKIKENEKNKVELERVKLAEIKKSQMAERAVKANAEVAQLAEIRKLSKEQKAEMAEEKKARAASIRADRERLQEVKLKQAAERQSVLAKIKEVPKAESPVDHIKKMTEKNAAFFYEGKSITSTRALQLIKANKDLHIQSRLKHDNKPEVYISSKPITVKQNN